MRALVVLVLVLEGAGSRTLAGLEAALGAAPEKVRCAVLTAYSAIWRQGRNPQFGLNPFE